jgi:antitoxin FitA
VQVRDLPEDVVATLKARAQARGQSLAAYLRDLLTQEAAMPPAEDVTAGIAARDPVSSRWTICGLQARWPTVTLVPDCSMIRLLSSPVRRRAAPAVPGADRPRSGADRCRGIQHCPRPDDHDETDGAHRSGPRGTDARRLRRLADRAASHAAAASKPASSSCGITSPMTTRCMSLWLSGLRCPC